MIKYEVFVQDKLPWSDNLIKMLQECINRTCQGHFRYGLPSKEKKYMTRLSMEFDRYKKTGNREHLRNILVYAVLESEAPENPKYHDDPYVKSATRWKLGGDLGDRVLLPRGPRTGD